MAAGTTLEVETLCNNAQVCPGLPWIWRDSSPKFSSLSQANHCRSRDTVLKCTLPLQVLVMPVWRLGGSGRTEGRHTQWTHCMMPDPGTARSPSQLWSSASIIFPMPENAATWPVIRWCTCCRDMVQATPRLSPVLLRRFEITRSLMLLIERHVRDS